MKIVKVILITVLLVSLESGLSILLAWLRIDYINEISINLFTIFLKVSYIFIKIASYSFILFVIFRMKFNYTNSINQLKELELKRILFILVITGGLFFFLKPFFDFIENPDFNKLFHIDIKDISEHSKKSLSFNYLLGTLIIAPIFEELFFRKYIFSEVLKKHSLITAIIVSSVLFSLVHLPIFRALPLAFFLGIMNSLIYYKTKNIIYPIILHFTWNLLVSLMKVYGHSYYDWIDSFEFNYIYFTLSIVGLVTTLLGIKYFIMSTKNTTEQLVIKNSQSNNS